MCVRVSGSTVYTCMLNKRGGAEADLTVSRLEPGAANLPLAPQSNGEKQRESVCFFYCYIHCSLCCFILLLIIPSLLCYVVIFYLSLDISVIVLYLILDLLFFCSILFIVASPRSYQYCISVVFILRFFNLLLYFSL